MQRSNSTASRSEPQADLVISPTASSVASNAATPPATPQARTKAANCSARSRADPRHRRRTRDHLAQCCSSAARSGFAAWIQADVDQPGTADPLGPDIAEPWLDQRASSSLVTGVADVTPVPAQDVHCLRDLGADAGIVGRWQVTVTSCARCRSESSAWSAMLTTASNTTAR